ncbi:putative MOB kinase activator family [Helianthus annuus]|uniref:MOB kinase activator family n=1 Tax=Helianthus annuus TaxID=4232 RepID=A0A251SMJ2_HELAN|nr:uncharacterized protein LOC110902385 [Helianthus annuus]KAF5771539.1 putative MOB kinase activator family [Helianthus annuus]
MRPTTGGNLDDAFLKRSLKTKRLRRLSSVGVLGETKKFSNLSHTIKYASTPRKLRSALEKRLHESRKTFVPTSPDSRKERDRFEWRLKDCTKKHITAMDEHKDSKLCLITKDEEEAAQALFALAQTYTETCMNKTSDMEPSSIMVPLNQTEETDVKNVLEKRCLVHVYICHFIKVVQTAESEGGHVNVISDTKSVCSH